MTDFPNQRACYCAPGETSCGICERCGVPGHTRHFPGPVPVTGAWCDRCYRFAGIRYRALRLAVPVVVAGGIFFALRACAG